MCYPKLNWLKRLPMFDLIDQASSGNLKAVRGLIDTGANVDAQDEQRRTALMLASKKGHLEIVKTLVNAGATLNLQSNEGGYGGNTALMYACRHGHLEIMKILIDSGANLNLRGNEWAREGYTALIYSAYNGHQKIVKALIDAGADVNIKDELLERTALIISSEKGYMEVVKVLIDAGADVNVQNTYGKTALIHASRKGHLEIVKSLIQAEANLNLQGQAEYTSEKGWTALIHASRVGYLEIVKSLVDAGADLNLKTKGGWTALMHASDQGHKEVVEVLQAAASGKTRDSDPSDPKLTVIFTSLFTALGYLSKVDGKVSQEEISFVTNGINEMQLDAEQRRQAEELFRMGKQAPAIALMTLLSNLKNEYENDCESLQEFMKILIQLIHVDHVISEQERLAIKEIATQLEIEQSVLNTIEDSLSKSKGHQRSTSSHQSQHPKRDNQSTEKAETANPSHSKLTKISAGLFEISGYLAKLDGRISREEIKAITGLIDEMQLERDQRRQAEDLFRRGKQSSEESMINLVSNLQDQYHKTPEVLNILVMILMQVAYSDGDMIDSEQQMIRTIAMQLSLDEIALSIIEVAVCCEIQNIKYLDLRDAYKMIGVSEAASDHDIKKARLRLLRTYHPDALQAKGLPKEMLVFGKRLSQTFNLAYDRIKADCKL